MPTAQLDPSLGVRVVSSRALRYDVPASLGDDRPPHVRAASGLAFVGGRLAVIQDDTAFIGYVAHGEVSALALPRGAGGRRRFEVALGNKMEKLDLEACVAVGSELWAFGSGSAPAREKIAVVEYTVRLHDAAPLYRRLRDEVESDVNIEGAAVVANEVWLFHRGNTGPADLGPAVVRFDRARLAAWLAAEGPVPDALRTDRYDLGSARGARLGFTDAVESRGRVFYLAAAEASDNAIDDGAVVAAQLGVIEGGGVCAAGGESAAAVVRACDLVIDGGPAKAEGLAFDPMDARRAWIAIDPDDVDEPARLHEIELVGPW